jgi:hypothetical protein
MRLSPRRIKSTPTIVLYELRMIGLKTRPSSLLRKLEATIKKWRGLVRWYMQGHTSMRGEVVIHIVGERFGRVNRVDNLVASWRRAIARIVLKKDHQQGGHEGVQQGGVQQGVQNPVNHPGNHPGGQVGVPTHSKRHGLSKHDLSKLKRATWIAMGSTNFYMDVQIMHENFDVAKAKMWAEVASAVDATMCSHTEPALPVDIGPSLAAPQPQIPPRVANMSRAHRLHDHVHRLHTFLHTQPHTLGSSRHSTCSMLSTHSTHSRRSTIRSRRYPSKSEAHNTTPLLQPHQHRPRPPE